MQFSKRTNWNTEESDLARAHRERRLADLPLADLTASNPTRCEFTYPSELLSALTNPRALDYDPQPNGLLPAREAVCRYYARHGAALTPDQIVLTTSTSESYSYLFRLLCDPGSEILIFQPGYPLFDFLATLDNVLLKSAPLIYENGWQIDPIAIRDAISSQTRVIIIVHPNNPTGHFTKPWESAQLAQLCREFNLALIVDEVFLDYGIGATGSSFASGLEDVPVFVVSGISKIAGLPQMKAAWIVASGPQRQRAVTRLEIIADTFLSMNAPVQWALPSWLESAAQIQQQIRDRVAVNLASLDSALSAVPAVQRLKFEGGWYAVLRIPALEPDEHAVLALLQRGVWLHPGYFFGMPETGWLVLSLLSSKQEFINGLGILINYFRTDQRSNKNEI